MFVCGLCFSVTSINCKTKAGCFCSEEDVEFNRFIGILPEGVSLTTIADFCHLGGIVRALNRWFKDDFTEEKYKDRHSRLNILRHCDTVMQQKLKREPKLKPVILKHSAQPFEVGYTSLLQTKRGAGSMYMFTNGIVDVVEESGDNVSDYDLVNRCRKI
jgi:hypothetical protein